MLARYGLPRFQLAGSQRSTDAECGMLPSDAAGASLLSLLKFGLLMALSLPLTMLASSFLVVQQKRKLVMHSCETVHG